MDIVYKNSWHSPRGGGAFHRPQYLGDPGDTTRYTRTVRVFAAEMANSLDMDALLDEVIARKGAYKYQDGFSEENWEEVTQRRVNYQ